MRKNMRKRGFTLTEILIVLAVIGLLTAILLPVLSRARENGRKTACASNLQQLGMAFQQYTQDHNRRYPGGGQKQLWANGGHWVKGEENYASTGANSTALALDGEPFTYQAPRKALVEEGALYDYTKNKQIYVCPSNTDGRKKELSYSMNCAIAGMSNVRVRQPSEIILLVDEAFANDGFFYTHGPTSTDQLTDVHNGGGNLLFADGHVKFYSRDQYPLKDTMQDASALTLKKETEGAPRFYDKAFGRETDTNYYVSSRPGSPPDPNSAFGSCADPENDGTP